jgi:hypothetical protein
MLAQTPATYARSISLSIMNDTALQANSRYRGLSLYVVASFYVPTSAVVRYPL